MMMIKKSSRATSVKKLSATATSLATTILSAGGVGILPTDTIYGIVGSALNKKTVTRIYALRKRNLKKPMIILISSLNDLQLFGIRLTLIDIKIIKKLWPGKVSIVVPCSSHKFEYLHRGSKTLAFRLPKAVWLTNIIKKTGPLVAPSANIEGEPASKTITAAKKYFGSNVEFYGDAGILNSQPSTIISLQKGEIVILRQGAVKV